MKAFYSTKELMALLGVHSYSTIAIWVKRRQIPFVRINNRARFPKTAIDRMIEKGGA